MRPLVLASLLAVATPFAPPAEAQTVKGLTFGYGYDLVSYGPVGVGDATTVGSGGGEIYYGFSEFDLTGLSTGTAQLSFALTRQEGLLDLLGPPWFVRVLPRSTTFTLGTYRGDNIASAPPRVLSPGGDHFDAGPRDFGVAFASFGSGSEPDPIAVERGDSSGRSALTIGQTFTLDVTDQFNRSLANGDPALGIALVSGFGQLVLSEALYSFGNWQLTVTPSAPVPEPESYALMVAGLGALAIATRRRSPFRDVKK